MTLSMIKLVETLGISIMLRVTFSYSYAECRYAECRYAECRYAECCYAECRYAEGHYAECRGTSLTARKIVLKHFTAVIYGRKKISCNHNGRHVSRFTMAGMFHVFYKLAISVTRLGDFSPIRLLVEGSS